MESRYVPPHMRGKKIAPEPVPEPLPLSRSENEFPTLSNPKNVFVFEKKLEKSFANMATEWASQHEEQKRMDDLRKQEHDSNELLRKQYRITPLPHFHNIRHFVEPEDDEEEDEEEQKPTETSPDDSGWTEVKPKKRRKVKTFEERMARPPTPEEKSDETVWNANEEDDSYWRR